MSANENGDDAAQTQQAAGEEMNEEGTCKRVNSTGELTSPSTISAAADDAMNAMLRNLKLPHEEQVEVTYTTRSGEVLTTLKTLRPLTERFVLSEAPDHPVMGVAVVGYSTTSKRNVMSIYNNDGCLIRWIVEDDPALVAAANHDIAALEMEDVRVVPSSRYTDVLNDRFVRVVIIGGPHLSRHKRAKEALEASKNVLCDRPVALSLQGAKELFSLARQTSTIFMPMLPGRPGKAFTAVVMALFSSAAAIECQRKLPDGFQASSSEPNAEDPQCMMMLTDVAMHDIFAVSFSICMRPLSVKTTRVASQAHCFQVQVTYPNRCVYTVKTGVGQDDLDTQLFKLTGDSLADMRRVDHMSHAEASAHAANSTFTQNADGESNTLRFTQEYEAARADALEQMYAMASGARALASRVRPQLMENNLCDCLRIAEAAYASLKRGSESVEIQYH